MSKQIWIFQQFPADLPSGKFTVFLDDCSIIYSAVGSTVVTVAKLTLSVI